MVFEGVGSVAAGRAAAGARVTFHDGARASIFPALKVFSVTAPDGRTCSLSSSQGLSYLAALCNHQPTAQAIRQHLGQGPWELAGKPTYLPSGKLPQVESAAMVDRYV